MMKRAFSLLMVAVMMFAMLPFQVFASEMEPVNNDPGFGLTVEENPSEEDPVVEETTEVPAPEEEPSEENTLPSEEEDPAEEEASAVRICEEGCILVGEEEHLENDGECFVWTACTVTEGCEGPAGHEGECYGAVVYAGPATITVSSKSYRNVYVVVSGEGMTAVYYVNSDGTIENTNGTEATFEPGSYTVYYGTYSNRGSFARGTVTVNQGSNATVQMSTASVNSNTAYATRVLYATSIYYNRTSFDHVDIRVDGSYLLEIGGKPYSATVSNPSVVVKVGGTTVASQSWSGTTSYEWRKTNLQLTKSKVITVEMVLDLSYTDSGGKKHTLEDVQIVYDSVNDVSKFIEAIAICDMVQGLDFQVSVEDIQEVIEYHTVSYEWKVYNTDGTYTSLPIGAPSEPATTSGHAAGEQYVYNMEFATGTSFYDYDNGLLYTFHGWDTYSNSGSYNPTVSSGYYGLDDGDDVASNNPTIEIKGDTYIYGYWTVTELAPSSAHIAIEKVFIVDGVETSMELAEDLWFRINTGVDRDGDDNSTVDVDYSMIAAAAGKEYKIPVYQYETPFVFTEYNAEVPGYTRTTSIQVDGEHIVSYTQNGDSVTVAMDPVYQGENVHLGTVTYTNTYTKNVGAPVHVYPVLTILKNAADTKLAQDGVGFTLYTDEACTDAAKTVITADGGLIFLDFGAVENIAAGTYYLKETEPLDGYHADPYVYAITLAASRTAEELRNGQYVQVTYYALSVTVPEGSAASHAEGSDRLYIYDAPILGSLNLQKEVVGIGAEDMEKLNSLVILHGPITRDAQGNITDIGFTWQIDLNEENGWAVSVEELALGEYLIHESFASVHGYTWTDVAYGNLETVYYNNITSGVFAVEGETPVELTLTNTYEEWTAADFYIKKVDENGNALAGAVFTVSADEAGSDVVMTKTSGKDGYAYFGGFTVPEGQTSVIYYLRETKAPDGYYLDGVTYKVEIKAVANEESTSYEPKITLADGTDVNFNNATDLLVVTNSPVVGKLTVTKAFTDGIIPEGLNSVSVQVGGPGGYNRTVELSNANGWSVTLDKLPLGEYTVSERNAAAPGYTWTVAYSQNNVTLAESAPGSTVPGTEISGAVQITNTYVRNDVFYEKTTSLTVKKVGEDGEALAGAVFTLNKLGKNGKSLMETVSFTTGADGIVVFDLLAGFVDEAGNVSEGSYILSETKAPEGYEATNATWTVTIKEDNGQVRVVLNENQNVFENFWDWVVGNVSPGTWEDGVLTVANVKKVGSLHIEKQVADPEGLYADEVYSFTLDCSNNTFDRTFELKANESITIENIPWGTTYTLTEETTGAAFTGSIADAGNGRIWEDETRIVVTNTYRYTEHNNGLNLVKVDADDNTRVIPGAGFTLYADEALTVKLGSEVFSDSNGGLNLPIEAAGTYFLAETTTPAGYHPNQNVYVVNAEQKHVVQNEGTADAVTDIQMHVRIAGFTGTTTNEIDYTYNIENTAIKQLVVNVEKVWEDEGYYGRPASVEVILYRDHKPFETVTLNEGNNWRYSWEDLTDEYVWSVDEAEIPSEYSKIIENDGNDWVITNIRVPKPVSITVTKAWEHNGGKLLPAAIGVTLYKNGEAWEIVTLNEENNWTYTWTQLNDASVWSVDETDVPAGYTKKITVDGYSFVITNTRTINPVEIRVEKVWVASEGVIHPESVEAVLYRDGEIFDTVVLSKENDWNYIWTDLTDEYTWSVDEKTVPEGYTKNVTAEGYDFTITNTKVFAYIDVSVQKIWYGADVKHPDSVKVTLYRDGVAYDTVTLDASNGWNYVWEDLTDEFEWTVDEPSVPSGYNKIVRRSGYNFTITNTHEDNPKTGDVNNLFGMGIMAAVGMAGFGVSAMALLAQRKKESEET